MPGTLTICYPHGELEYRLTERKLQVGDELTRNGDTWVVTEVREEPDGTTTISVRPKRRAETDGSPAEGS